MQVRYGEGVENHRGEEPGAVVRKDGGEASDASPPSLRTTAHGSGPMWLATPSPYRTCTDYSLPVSRRTAKDCGHYRDERGSTGNLRSLFRSIDAPPPGCRLPPASAWMLQALARHGQKRSM